MPSGVNLLSGIRNATGAPETTGKAFPIDTFEPKSTEERIKCHNRGGMGVFLIKSIMDNIQIEQKKDYYIFRFMKKIQPKLIKLFVINYSNH